MSDERPPAPRFPLRLDRLAPALRTAQSTESAGSGPSTAQPLRPVLRPQQPVQHAAQDRQRSRIPAGAGLDSAGVRARMVDRLRARGVAHAGLLAAMARVPRHAFVDSALISQAYEDTSLPIGHGQTISKPSVVARMIELLLDGRNAVSNGHLGRCLEIGTGCGYQAAVLSELSRQLISVERLKALHDKARLLLEPQRAGHLRLVFGDGMHGHPPNAPYDSIIAAAGGDQLPAQWLDQLAIGGRLVAPLADAAGAQVLMVVDRTADGWDRRRHEAVQFVPLKSGVV